MKKVKKTIVSEETRQAYIESCLPLLSNCSMGERIHELRVVNNLTLEELGNKIGVQSSAVSKWEKNRVTNIPSEKLNALAKLFGCTTDYLINGSVVPPVDDTIGEVIDLYSRITPEQRLAVLNLLRSFTATA